MKIECEDHERITILTITGDITSESADILKRNVSERLSDTARDFVLQIEHVNFIDSAGLETLLWLQDETAERMGQIRLVNPTEDVKTILNLTGLSHHFEAYDQITSAIKSLR